MIKVWFAGSAEFSVPFLEALMARQDLEVRAVLTRPDRPRGRGQRLGANSVKQRALAMGLKVFDPKGLVRALDFQNISEALVAQQINLVVVVAYGCIIPQGLLSVPPRGWINVHASLLPRWRGAAPIQHAILSGDQKTGISIMRIDPGIDTGDYCIQRACPILSLDTAGTLGVRLQKEGCLALHEGLDQILQSRVDWHKQPLEGETYADKLKKASAEIDWNLPAITIERKIRAFLPWPVAWFLYQGKRIQVLAAEACLSDNRVPAGTFIGQNEQANVVQTASGALRLLCLKCEGRKPGLWHEVKAGAPFNSWNIGDSIISCRNGPVSLE